MAGVVPRGAYLFFVGKDAADIAERNDTTGMEAGVIARAQGVFAHRRPARFPSCSPIVAQPVLQLVFCTDGAAENNKYIASGRGGIMNR
jgi:hypothetical protein